MAVTAITGAPAARSVTLCAFLLLASALFGQQSVPAAQDPLIRVKVNEVLVPVTVLDSRGRPVEGLRTSDFRLYDDNVQQHIAVSAVNAAAAVTVSAKRENVPSSAPDNPAPIRSSETSAIPQAQPRTYVICFDALHTSPESFFRSRAALEKFLRADTEGSPRIALVSLGTRIQVLQTATPDLALIRRRLESRDFLTYSSTPERVDFYAAINSLKEQMERYCSGCPCGRSASEIPGGCKQAQEQIRQGIDTTSDHFAAIARTFLTGLRVLADEEGKLGGLTTLVLISDGFTLQPGKELYAVASAHLPNSAQFSFQPPYDLQPALEEVIQSAVRSNIVIQSIDSRGVYNPSFLPGGLQDASSAQMGRSAATNRGGTLYAEMDSKWSSIAFDHGSALKQIADATGGQFHHNDNDLRKAVASAFLEGREYYVVAYSPARQGNDGRFHPIKVEVTTRPGLTVLAKRGYWAEPAQ